MKKTLTVLALLLLPGLLAGQVDSYPNSVGRYDGGPPVAAAIETINYNCSTFFTCTGSPGTGPTATFTLGLANNAFSVLPSVAVDNANDICAFRDTSGGVMAQTACANIGAGGGGAPTDATYLTQTAHASLSAEQAFSALSTGILRVATTTGVVTSLTDSAGIAANVSDETGTGAMVFGTSPTITTSLTVGAAGVVFTEDGDGQLRIAGLGDGSDEDIAINLDDTANTGVVTSSTGLNVLNFSGIKLQTSGVAIPDPLDTTVSWFREDFDKNGDGTSTVHDWYIAFSGGTFPEIASIAARPGIRSLSTGTGATDWAYVGRGNKELLFSGGATVAKTSINIQNLADATDDYDLYWGHFDGIAVNIVDGCYFHYNRDVSVNWQIVCENNAVETSSRFTTGTAVATGWHKLEIRVNAAGTSASFFYDDAEVTNSPITTNIPTSAGRETGHVFFIEKEAGTTARAVWIDYWMFMQTLTAAR